MFLIFWEFIVKEEMSREFELHYNANGTWAKFFRNGNGYLETELLKDVGTERRYITIDKWISEEAFKTFREENLNEYKMIDIECEKLTEFENHLGSFSTRLEV